MSRLFATLITLLLAVAAPAQTPAVGTAPPPMPAGTPEMRVGVFTMPPFAVPLGKDQWGGVSVSLFRQVAEQMKLPYRLVSYDSIHAALEALRKGELDIVAVGLDVTPERETFMDFSRAFEQSGTSAVVRLDRAPTLVMIGRQMLQSHLPRMLLALIAIMITVAVVLAFFERHRNPTQFGGSWFQSVGESLWWSVTTMTTVGYGDRVPVTRGGRFLGGVWMLLAFVLMTIVGGVIASELTVSRFQPMLRSVDQLAKVRCGVVQDSAAETRAQEQNLRAERFADLSSALRALQDLKVDAVLGDTSSLRWSLRSGMYPDLAVLPDPLVVDYVCLGLSHQVPQEVRNGIDYWVLRISQSKEWQASRRSNSGDSP